jgi:hypothetical protein
MKPRSDKAFVKHRSSVQARLAAPQNTTFPVHPGVRPPAGSAASAGFETVRCTDPVQPMGPYRSPADRADAAGTAPEAQPSIGARVVITGGLAVGKEGIVLERWPRDINGRIAQWVVQSHDLVRKRVIRADYLRVLP